MFLHYCLDYQRALSFCLVPYLTTAPQIRKRKVNAEVGKKFSKFEVQESFIQHFGVSYYYNLLLFYIFS